MWRGNADGDFDIYFYQISNGITTKVSSNSKDDDDPQVDGDYIVWEGNKDGDFDIYLYQISSSTTLNVSE